ncbi:unnamed protein product [Closterium sp. Naga37s-1]|nr:unnamed protein product [Closterium sp. Naga37s-1]
MVRAILGSEVIVGSYLPSLPIHSAAHLCISHFPLISHCPFPSFPLPRLPPQLCSTSHLRLLHPRLSHSAPVYPVINVCLTDTLPLPAPHLLLLHLVFATGSCLHSVRTAHRLTGAPSPPLPSRAVRSWAGLLGAPWWFLRADEQREKDMRSDLSHFSTAFPPQTHGLTPLQHFLPHRFSPHPPFRPIALRPYGTDSHVPLISHCPFSSFLSPPLPPPLATVAPHCSHPVRSLPLPIPSPCPLFPFHTPSATPASPSLTSCLQILCPYGVDALLSPTRCPFLSPSHLTQRFSCLTTSTAPHLLLLPRFPDPSIPAHTLHLLLQHRFLPHRLPPTYNTVYHIPLITHSAVYPFLPLSSPLHACFAHTNFCLADSHPHGSGALFIPTAARQGLLAWQRRREAAGEVGRDCWSHEAVFFLKNGQREEVRDEKYAGKLWSLGQQQATGCWVTPWQLSAILHGRAEGEGSALRGIFERG